MKTQRNWPTAMAAAVLTAFVALPTAAAADTWNERTVLTFSEPVMIPGATLPPGEYIFKLADSKGTRHLVQVFEQDGRELVTLTQAVPVRRRQPTGDTILTFNPTDRGTPALKAWYYPHSSYGHEFIYPENEARHIAERSKTIVLSIDANDVDLDKGTLRLYHPGGTSSEWLADTETMKEWDTWQRDRVSTATADDRSNGSGGPSEDDEDTTDARAPMMMTNPSGLPVDLDDLESNPAKYTGKTISVDAEVEEVYGPRLFTIDESHWGDLDGEVLVFAPTMLAALVKDDDRITVTGMLRPVAVAEIEKEWGWFDDNPELEVELLDNPVLVAERIVGGNNNLALLIDTTPGSTNARTSAAGTGVIMDPGTIGSGTTDLVGRSVDLQNVRVLRMAQHEGFFADLAGGAVLVLPARNAPVTVKPGDTVSIRGAVAETPDEIGKRINPPSGWNQQIYIVATSVTK